VLDRAPLADNTWFFSGLLIGAEVASLGDHAEKRPVVIAAARHLSELYALALEAMADPAVKWTCLPPEKVEQATTTAHAVFLRNRSARD
jgi:2-keto-3-deoxy-galactonokinase